VTVDGAAQPDFSREGLVLIFALKTLLADRGKLLTGVAGVIFSLVLVNVQGGLFLGLIHKASVLIDHCDADLWIGHQGIENVDFAEDIPELWINRIRGIESVERVDPYIVGKGIATLADGGFEDVWVIGSDPASMLGTGWSFVAGSSEDLKRPDAVSFDEVDAPKLGNPQIGDWLEVNSHRAKFVARTRGITGSVTTPYLFATLETARRLSNRQTGYCSFFLVKGPERGRYRTTSPRSPSAPSRRGRPHAARVRADLAGLLDEADGNRHQLRRCDRIGSSGGPLDGGAEPVRPGPRPHRRLRDAESAGGRRPAYLRVIVQQSAAIAFVGSVTGVAVVIAIRQCWSSPFAPVDIPLWLAGWSVAFVFAICLAASLLPYLRVRSIDPAVVLQG